MSQTGGLKKFSKTTFSNNFRRTHWETLSAMFLGKLLNLTNASFLSLYSHTGAYNLFLLPREEYLLSVTYNLCYIFTLPFVLFLGSLTYLYSFGNSVFFFSYFQLKLFSDFHIDNYCQSSLDPHWRSSLLLSFVVRIVSNKFFLMPSLKFLNSLISGKLFNVLWNGSTICPFSCSFENTIYLLKLFVARMQASSCFFHRSIE